jgi:hypothetical protein
MILSAIDDLKTIRDQNYITANDAFDQEQSIVRRIITFFSNGINYEKWLECREVDGPNLKNFFFDLAQMFMHAIRNALVAIQNLHNVILDDSVTREWPFADLPNDTNQLTYLRSIILLLEIHSYSPGSTLGNALENVFAL